MKTIDILICTLNKGIVRVGDILMPPREEIRYIVSFQYTDDRYLDLVPPILKERADVSFYTLNGQGLSCNRNNALEKAILNQSKRLIADPNASLELLLPGDFELD